MCIYILRLLKCQHNNIYVKPIRAARYYKDAVKIFLEIKEEKGENFTIFSLSTNLFQDQNLV